MMYLASIVPSFVPLLRCALWYVYSIDYVCTNVKQKIEILREMFLRLWLTFVVT
nr:MAG TPA: hypothetical protein [Caudoviricetes sp.]